MTTRSTPLGPQSPHSDLLAEIARLTTEDLPALRLDLDSLATLDLITAMNAADQEVPVLVGRAAPSIARAIDAITERMERGGRLIYIGAGTPGRLGVVDASECRPTFGTPADLVVGVVAGGDRAIRNAVEGAEDDYDAGGHDLAALTIGPVDCVVGISASGRTPYVVGALEYARQVGSLTVALACNEDSRIGSLSDVAVEIVVGPEFLAGSTRLKAGTAQKLVLNMLSTLTMVRQGKTYGNVMVDFIISNDKLQARAERTIMSLTAVDEETAATALEASDGSVKLALISILSGLSVADASALLREHDGHLTRALAVS